MRIPTVIALVGMYIALASSSVLSDYVVDSKFSSYDAASNSLVVGIAFSPLRPSIAFSKWNIIVTAQGSSNDARCVYRSTYETSISETVVVHLSPTLDVTEKYVVELHVDGRPETMDMFFVTAADGQALMEGAGDYYYRISRTRAHQ